MIWKERARNLVLFCNCAKIQKDHSLTCLKVFCMKNTLKSSNEYDWVFFLPKSQINWFRLDWTDLVEHRITLDHKILMMNGYERLVPLSKNSFFHSSNRIQFQTGSFTVSFWYYCHRPMVLKLGWFFRIYFDILGNGWCLQFLFPELCIMKKSSNSNLNPKMVD